MHQLLNTAEAAWDVAAVPGLLLLALCLAPRPLHERVRAAVNPWLARVVPRQLGWVAWAQRARSPLLDPIVRTSALSVTVEFYLMGLPALYIIGLKREAFILTTALAITTAVTCALKDIMCGPRPVHVVGAAAASVGAAHAAQGLNTAHAGHADGMHAAHGDGTGGGSRQATKVPRIEVLETPRDVEYGAPSMHTSLALVMNLAVAQLAAPLLSGPMPRPGAVPLEHVGHTVVGYACSVTGLKHHCMAPMLLHGCALAWTAWIGWSRLYLGVHTPVDLAMGLFTGSALVSALVGPVGHWWFSALATSKAALWIQAAVYAWAVLNYPKPRAHTSSYVYTVTFLGAHLGLSAGDAAAWRGSRAAVALHSAALRALPAGVVQQLATLAAPSTAGGLVVKVAVGLTLVLVVRSVTSAVLRVLTRCLLACVPSGLRRLCQPPIAFGALAMVNPDGTYVKDMCHHIDGTSGAGPLHGSVPSSPPVEVAASSTTDGTASSTDASQQDGRDSTDGVAVVTSADTQETGLKQRKGQATACDSCPATDSTTTADGEQNGHNQTNGSSASAAGNSSPGASKRGTTAAQLLRAADQKLGEAVKKLAGGSVRGDGVLLREDGVTPWDCDTIRRYMTYCLAVWAVNEYCHFLEFAAAAVGQVV